MERHLVDNAQSRLVALLVTAALAGACGVGTGEGGVDTDNGDLRRCAGCRSRDAGAAPAQADAASGAGVDAQTAPPPAVDAGAPPPAPVAGAWLFGARHTPNNRPISDWAPDILAHYGGSSIVDGLATSDLQQCIANSGTWGSPYIVFAQDSYSIYFAMPGDPEYPIADSSGATRTCPLDQGKGWLGVRIPPGAHVWSASDSNAISSPDDTHITIVDVERNRVYAFYAEGGALVGLRNGKWQSSYRGCDLLSPDGPDGAGDAAIAQLSSASNRYSCGGGAGYPSAGCGLAGTGAGLSVGSGFGNGDSNGFLGPHGVIMPEDFDDTGWSGEAVGTLHHALRCSNPNAYQYGYMWPMQDPGAGSPGRALRDGQIIRLDPAVDVGAMSAPAQEKRLLKTMQVYGCVLSDYATYGMALFAQSAWDGTGPRRGANPWTAAGGASAEAQAFYQGANGNGVKFGALSHLDLARLQVVLPHGAAFPAR